MRASLLATDRQLAQQSYYEATAEPAEPVARYPALAESTTCDVAVVGGGLAGLSAALELAERGFDVVLLEAHEIGWGASGRNGGQAIHGLACEQSTIEAQLGLDDARRIWAMSLEALDLLRQRIQRHAIDCEWRDGYLGLVGGIELTPLPGQPAKRAFDIFLDLFAHGLLIRTTGDTLALSPPLIISAEQITQVVEMIRAALRRAA